MPELYHTARQLPLFPEKKCAKCPNSYPATTDYFYRDRSNSDKLHSYCKKCCDEYDRKRRPKKGRRPVSIVTLICSRCDKEFQRKKADYDFAIRNFGTQPVYCSRACMYNKPSMMPIPPSIAQEYLQGKSCHEIAVEYNVKWTTIQYHLKRMGIPLRPVGSLNSKGSPSQGKHPGEATRKKISEAAIRQFSTPEAREMLRQRGYRMLAEGTFKSVSKLEDKVAEELTKRGIAFTRQHPIAAHGHKGFIACVDFMLTDGRVIEVNGTYWHSDPRRYPDGPISVTQKHNYERYVRKMTKIAALNIPVIELWEIDLCTDIAGTIENALKSN